MTHPSGIPVSEVYSLAAAIEYNLSPLSGLGAKFTEVGAHINREFRHLNDCYQAPEREQLVNSTQRVQDSLGEFGPKLPEVSQVLAGFATGLRAFARELNDLRNRAYALEQAKSKNPDWQNDQALVNENNEVTGNVSLIVTGDAGGGDTTRIRRLGGGAMTIPALALNAANEIAALYGGRRWQANGQHEGDIPPPGPTKEERQKAIQDIMEGKFPPPAPPPPWGGPVERDYPWYQDVGNFLLDVGEGIVTGLGGAVEGLLTVVPVLPLLASIPGVRDFAKDTWGWEMPTWNDSLKGVIGVAKLGLAIILAPVLVDSWLVDKIAGKDLSPQWMRDMRKTGVDAAKGFVAWDEWGENPGKAFGMVLTNVVTTVAGGGVIGEARAASMASKFGKAAPVVAKGIDAVNYLRGTRVAMRNAALGLVMKIPKVSSVVEGLAKIPIVGHTFRMADVPNAEVPAVHGIDSGAVHPDIEVPTGHTSVPVTHPPVVDPVTRPVVPSELTTPSTSAGRIDPPAHADPRTTPGTRPPGSQPDPVVPPPIAPIPSTHTPPPSAPIGRTDPGSTVPGGRTEPGTTTPGGRTEPGTTTPGGRTEPGTTTPGGRTDPSTSTTPRPETGSRTDPGTTGNRTDPGASSRTDPASRTSEARTDPGRTPDPSSRKSDARPTGSNDPARSGTSPTDSTKPDATHSDPSRAESTTKPGSDRATRPDRSHTESSRPEPNQTERGTSDSTSAAATKHDPPHTGQSTPDPRWTEGTPSPEGTPVRAGEPGTAGRTADPVVPPPIVPPPVMPAHAGGPSGAASDTGGSHSSGETGREAQRSPSGTREPAVRDGAGRDAAGRDAAGRDGGAHGRIPDTLDGRRPTIPERLDGDPVAPTPRQSIPDRLAGKEPTIPERLAGVQPIRGRTPEPHEAGVRTRDGESSPHPDGAASDARHAEGNETPRSREPGGDTPNDPTGRPGDPLRTHEPRADDPTGRSHDGGNEPRDGRESTRDRDTDAAGHDRGDGSPRRPGEQAPQLSGEDGRAVHGNLEHSHADQPVVGPHEGQHGSHPDGEPQVAPPAGPAGHADGEKKFDGANDPRYDSAAERQRENEKYLPDRLKGGEGKDPTDVDPGSFSDHDASGRFQDELEEGVGNRQGQPRDVAVHALKRLFRWAHKLNVFDGSRALKMNCAEITRRFCDILNGDAPRVAKGNRFGNGEWHDVTLEHMGLADFPPENTFVRPPGHEGDFAVDQHAFQLVRDRLKGRPPGTHANIGIASKTGGHRFAAFVDLDGSVKWFDGQNSVAARKLKDGSPEQIAAIMRDMVKDGNKLPLPMNIDYLHFAVREPGGHWEGPPRTAEHDSAAVMRHVREEGKLKSSEPLNLDAQPPSATMSAPEWFAGQAKHNAPSAAGEPSVWEDLQGGHPGHGADDGVRRPQWQQPSDGRHLPPNESATPGDPWQHADQRYVHEQGNPTHPGGGGPEGQWGPREPHAQGNPPYRPGSGNPRYRPGPGSPPSQHGQPQWDPPRVDQRRNPAGPAAHGDPWGGAAEHRPQDFGPTGTQGGPGHFGPSGVPDGPGSFGPTGVVESSRERWYEGVQPVAPGGRSTRTYHPSDWHPQGPWQSELANPNFRASKADSEALRGRYRPYSNKQLDEFRRRGRVSLGEQEMAKLTDTDIQASELLLNDFVENMNRAFHVGDVRVEKNPIVRCAISAMHKMPNFSGTVHRGVRIRDPKGQQAFVDSHELGGTVRYKGFTHSDKAVAGGHRYEIMVHIESRFGKDMTYLRDPLQGIEEVIHLPHSDFYPVPVPKEWAHAPAGLEAGATKYLDADGRWHLFVRDHTGPYHPSEAMPPEPQPYPSFGPTGHDPGSFGPSGYAPTGQGQWAPPSEFGPATPQYVEPQHSHQPPRQHYQQPQGYQPRQHYQHPQQGGYEHHAQGGLPPSGIEHGQQGVPPTQGSQAPGDWTPGDPAYGRTAKDGFDPAFHHKALGRDFAPGVNDPDGAFVGHEPEIAARLVDEGWQVDARLEDVRVERTKNPEAMVRRDPSDVGRITEFKTVVERTRTALKRHINHGSGQVPPATGEVVVDGRRAGLLEGEARDAYRAATAQAGSRVASKVHMILGDGRMLTFEKKE